jgi:SAM-dependent methyltransferase
MIPLKRLAGVPGSRPGRLRLAALRGLRALGFGTTPFYFGDSKTCRDLGRRKSRELFALERHYHKLISGEPSAERRTQLYVEFNEAAKQFKKTHLPETKTFGFDPVYIESNRELFRGTVLDFGCGYGASTHCLAESADLAVGVDVSRMCIESAAATGSPRVRFEHVHDMTLPFPDGTFDAAYSNDVLEHIHVDDAEAHLREVLRVLRPGGKYLLYTPGRAVGPSDMTKAFWPQGFGFPALGSHIHEYTFDELSGMMVRCGFESPSRPPPGSDVLIVAQKPRRLTSADPA